jgi:hypothetical protein
MSTWIKKGISRTDKKTLRALCPVLLLPWFIMSCDLMESNRVSDREDEFRAEIAIFESPEKLSEHPEYFEAVQLAFWEEGELKAHPLTALKFLHQRNAIRTTFSDEFPETERFFTMPWESGMMITRADTSMIPHFTDPELSFFDDLDPEIRPDSVTYRYTSIDESIVYALIYFPKNYNVEVMIAKYKKLPGLENTFANGLGTFGGNPFPVYPGYENGTYYYIIHKITFIAERTSLFRMTKKGELDYKAELLATTDQAYGKPFNEMTTEIMRRIKSDFSNRISLN